MDRAEAEASAGPLHITVAVGLGPGRVDQVEMSLPAGATLGDAVLASGCAIRHPGLGVGSWRTAVWGVLRPAAHPLRDRDRVELLRPLGVDPKEARRLRYRQQRGTR